MQVDENTSTRRPPLEAECVPYQRPPVHALLPQVEASARGRAHGHDRRDDHDPHDGGWRSGAARRGYASGGKSGVGRPSRLRPCRRRVCAPGRCSLRPDDEGCGYVRGHDRALRGRAEEASAYRSAKRQTVDFSPTEKRSWCELRMSMKLSSHEPECSDGIRQSFAHA
jgi:hypothetical protein